MVLPGDSLKVNIRHVAMRDGNLVVKIMTTNDRDEKVLEGSAEVAQPPTAYVFTGQGSQEPGMGMDLYNSSPAARAVWEGADAHLLARRRRPFTLVASRGRPSASVTWT